MPFTEKELEEIRKADEEIDREYRIRRGGKMKKKTTRPQTLKEYHRAYYQAHREEIIAKRKKYYQENKEKIQERKRLYYQANKG